MDLSEFESAIRLKHPEWGLKKGHSGVATWIDVVAENDGGYTIQVTPNDGIGLSRHVNGESDFGGHDEVFGDLVDVLRFLEARMARP